MDLEKLRGLKQHPWVEQDPEESVLLLSESLDSCFGSSVGYNSLQSHMVLSIDGGRQLNCLHYIFMLCVILILDIWYEQLVMTKVMNLSLPNY